MRLDEERPRITGGEQPSGVNALGFLGRIVTFAAGALLLVTAFVFSLLVFALVVAAGLLIWGYVWWKTRELRRHIRERPPGGHVIEGEAIRDVTPHDKAER